MQASSLFHVLALDLELDDLRILQNSLRHLSCSVILAESAEQAVDQARHAFPYLVILAGDRQNWSRSFVSQLRLVLKVSNSTIVALTDCHAPSWSPEEEHPGLDGFLVRPLTNDVLDSLVQSAWAKQACSHAS